MQTCEHLAPLERLLAAGGHPVGPGRPCPHDPDWGTWHHTRATLDLHRLGRALALDPCVVHEAYEGLLSGSDVTYYCTACKRAIVGRLPAGAVAATMSSVYG